VRERLVNKGREKQSLFSEEAEDSLLGGRHGLLLGFADGARDGAGAAAAGGGAAAAARGGSAAATTAAAVAVAASLLPVTATGPVMWWCSLFSLSSSVVGATHSLPLLQLLTLMLASSSSCPRMTLTSRGGCC